MEILRGIVESPVAPSTSMAWLKGNELKHFSKGKWTTVGVPTVSSVEELNPDAPQGTLATVSNIKTEEIEVEDKFSVRDIYVEENPDCEPLMELKLKVPETWPTKETILVFGQKGYNSFEEVVTGNSLVLVLTSEGVFAEVFINGEITINDIILFDSVNEELLNAVNDTISSWGGIVFYGTLTPEDEPSFIPLTDIQTSYIDSIIEGYVTGTHIETIEIHINEIYFKETTGWRKINDVKIVDSVDNLDKNAEQGSLASVAINTFGEVSFSELYQPTSDEVNLNAGIVDTANLSSVSGISINSAYDTSIELHNFTILLFSKDLNMQGGVGQLIGLTIGGAITQSASTQEFNELELFTPNEDGTITVNEENLAIINNLLSSTEFVYGRVNGDPSCADMFYKSINGVKKTDLYIKGVDGWKLYKDTLSIPRIGIVNDLTTGGTNKALSAEMGKALSEKNNPLDSTSKLSDNDPIGTLRTVVFANEFSSSNFVAPSSFVSKVDRVWEINFRENPYATVAQKFSSWSLRNKLGSYISISANRPSIPGNLYDITYSENYGATKTLCGYSINSGINSIDYDNLASLNESLKNGEYFSDYISGAISLGGGAYRYGVDELLTAAKDAEIYNWKSLACLRTSGGWSIFPKVVNNLSDGGSTEPLSAEMGKELSETISELSNKVNVVVDSIDWLPEDAEVGSMAFVLDTQEGKVPLTISYKNGQLLRNINIYAPEKSDIIATERITMTFQTYVSNAGGYIPLSIIIGPPPASFNSNVEWGLFVDIQRATEGKMTLASYDGEGNRTAFNQFAVDRLLSELSSYYYSPNGTISEEDEDTINSFFSVNGEIKTPILFTKNTLKWEEYDKANKDKVATLESKVAELEAKIQELLQS